MAAKQKITDRVIEMVAPILQEAGLELIDVEYKKEGANWFLRVFIDRLSGAVDLDDCALVSEALSVQLDERDPIPNAYFLEVSSAGAERPLKTERDFERAISKRVHITFYEPYAGVKFMEGTLTHYEQDQLEMVVDEQPVLVPTDKIAGARLAIEW